MPIAYEVVLNKLTTPDSYAPRVKPKNTVTLANLLKDISAASTLAPADVEATVVAFIERVQAELIRGNQVKVDGLAIFSASIKAKLASPNADLPAGAKVNVNVKAHPGITKAVREGASLERVEASSQTPNLASVVAITGMLDELVENNVIEITGSRLKFDPSKSDEGVFFVPPSGPALRASTYINLGDSKITLVVPALSIGTVSYTLQVRSRRKNSLILRTGSWPTPIVSGA